MSKSNGPASVDSGEGRDPYGPGSHGLLAEPSDMPARYPIKGVVEVNGNRVYHRPDSQMYQITKPEVWFDAPSSAESAGFRLASSHPPEADSTAPEPGASMAAAESGRGAAAVVGGALVGEAALDTDRHPHGIGSHRAHDEPLDMPRFHPIKGTVRGDGTKLYHRPDSRSYLTTIPSVWFDSPSAAEIAGYSLGPDHPPIPDSTTYEPGGSGHPWSAVAVDAARRSAGGEARRTVGADGAAVATDATGGDPDGNGTTGLAGRQDGRGARSGADEDDEIETVRPSEAIAATGAAAAASAGRPAGEGVETAPSRAAGGGFGGRVLGDEERPGCVRPISLVVALAVLVILLALVVSQCGGDNGATTDDGTGTTDGGTGTSDTDTGATDGTGADESSTDENIRARARAALDDPAYDDVTVEVEDGTVRLAGNVATPADIATAELAVAGLDGVRAVDNQLVAAAEGGSTGTGTGDGTGEETTPPSSADEDLRTAIVTALTDGGVEVNGITVRVEDGVPTLTGEVPSETQLAAATTAVESMDGVTDFANELVVADGETPPAEPVDSDPKLTG